MIKLVSVNMEGMRHTDRILGLLEREQPECVALQEAPESFAITLTKLGYHTAFAKMQSRKGEVLETDEGIMIASKYPFIHHTEYYHHMATNEVPYLYEGWIMDSSFPYLFATITLPNQKTISIATTHAPVTNDGHSDNNQTTAIMRLLDIIGNEIPHVLCGDFNMPRGVNTLYQNLMAHYTDTIPPEYTSSLDRNLHRSGKSTTLNAPIFDIYMVDYIFTKAPYHADTVRLEFGVSDHAAVIGNISSNL